MAAMMSLDRSLSVLPGFLLVEAFFLSSPLRALVHEGGHALAARAVGSDVYRVSFGFGPLRRRFWLCGIPVEVRRHIFAGSGLTEFIPPEGDRLRSLVIMAGGAAANGVAALLTIFADNALGDGPLAYLGAPILTGICLSQLLGLANLLPFHSRLQNLSSDGRQILGFLLQRPAPIDAAQRAQSRAIVLVARRRFKAAAASFAEMAQLKRGSPYAFSMALHCFCQDGGAPEALAFYRQNREAIEAAISAPAEDETPLTPLLQANIAWVALEAAPQEEQALADAYSKAAMEAEPDGVAALGARGTFFLAQRQTAEAGELLLKAIRGMEPGPDRADLAGLLAQTSRSQGDDITAEAFECLRRYILKVAC